MTIPDRPLVFETDPGKITQREMRVMTKQGFDLYEFHEFLAKHTNYTLDEILDMTNDELTQIAEQLGKSIQERAVPLSS